jgi:hypothetical protein
MSASPAPADTCPHCGADVPRRARFCPECGTPLEEPANRTLEAELPPPEDGPVPVAMHEAEPRWFGVTPPSLLLGLCAALLALAVALFALGRWPYGLIVLGIGALLLAVFLEAARRRPGEHAALRAGADARERVRSRVEELRVRSAATVEARRIQAELLTVEEERKARLADLGAAVHARDSTAEAGARAALAELDRREEELQAGLDARLREAGERIRQAKLPVQETMMVAPSQPPDPSPAGPPQPAVVPEPYPPPDEGNPPEPARVPEPTPDQPRED